MTDRVEICEKWGRAQEMAAGTFFAAMEEAEDVCPVCGAALRGGDRIYFSRDGRAVGCVECLCEKYV